MTLNNAKLSTISIVNDCGTRVFGHTGYRLVILARQIRRYICWIDSKEIRTRVKPKSRPYINIYMHI